jgi:hypothetical protein
VRGEKIDKKTGLLLPVEFCAWYGTGVQARDSFHREEVFFVCFFTI